MRLSGPRSRPTTQKIWDLRICSQELWPLDRGGRSVSHVNYLGVIFDKRITWRLHLQMIKAKAFRTHIRIYSILKSERLSADIKRTIHMTLIRSVITYACPACELVADTYLWKLQRLQNKVLRTIGNFPRRTTVRDLHTAFSLPYVYDYVTDNVQETSRSHTEWWEWTCSRYKTRWSQTLQI
jgi:hypothetical protein